MPGTCYMVPETSAGMVETGGLRNAFLVMGSIKLVISATMLIGAASKAKMVASLTVPP